MKITVWSKTEVYCAGCVQTKKKLDKFDLPYEERSLERDAGPAQLEAFRAEGLLAAPVVIVELEDGETRTWSGFRPDLVAEIAVERTAVEVDCE